jgi:hypothetical protein
MLLYKNFINIFVQPVLHYFVHSENISQYFILPINRNVNCCVPDRLTWAHICGFVYQCVEIFCITCKD